MLRRATDFWREALVPLVTENHQIAKFFSGHLHKAAQHTNAITKGHANRNMPHTLFNSVQGFKWSVKEDGYFVLLKRGENGKWSMRTRAEVQLKPPDGFLTGLEENTALPSVLIGELVTEWNVCAEKYRSSAETRGLRRNEQFSKIHKIFEGDKKKDNWLNLRVKVFAFPTAVAESGVKMTVGEQYEASVECMKDSFHKHQHIGVCKFAEVKSTEDAIRVFNLVVQMGLEGIVIVNPNVHYADLDGNFFKLKQKIVSGRQQVIPVHGTKKEHPHKPTEYAYQTTIGNETMRFFDQQAHTGEFARNRHARVKWMEYVPEMAGKFPCNEAGYRHMHFTTNDDMTVEVPVVNGHMKDQDVYEITEMLGGNAGVNIFNPQGFRGKTAPTGPRHPASERVEKAKEPTPALSPQTAGPTDEATRTKPDTHAGDEASKPITFDSDSEPPNKRKSDTEAAAGAARAAAKPKAPVRKVHKEQRVTTTGGHAHAQKPPNAPDAPDAPQDGGAPPESATKRETVDEYMKSKEREEAEDKKRRDARLAKMSNGRLSYIKRADISHLLRQLQIYST
jgi:hypothetical protein